MRQGCAALSVDLQAGREVWNVQVEVIQEMDGIWERRIKENILSWSENVHFVPGECLCFSPGKV